MKTQIKNLTKDFGYEVLTWAERLTNSVYACTYKSIKSQDRKILREEKLRLHGLEKQIS